MSSASRSSTSAATELPEGVALSKMSFGRVISCSWSVAVSKNPPLSRSANSREDDVRQLTDAVSQRGSNVASYSASSPSATLA